MTDLACLLLELVKVELDVVKVKLEMVEVELEVVKVELAVEWLVVVKGMERLAFSHPRGTQGLRGLEQMQLRA